MSYGCEPISIVTIQFPFKCLEINSLPKQCIRINCCVLKIQKRGLYLPGPESQSLGERLGLLGSLKLSG